MTDTRNRDQRLYDAAERAFDSEGGFIAPAVQNSQRATETSMTLVAPCETVSVRPVNGAPLASEELVSQEARFRMRERIMEEASVTCDGRHYYYDGHRYDRLVDAINHSGLMHSRPLHQHQPGPFTVTPPVDMPTDADSQLMAALDISFVAGWYCFEGFRYEQLADAVGYARLR